MFAKNCDSKILNLFVGDWSAKALLLERAGDVSGAAKLLLDCLADSSQFHLERLDNFLHFAKRVSPNLTQGKLRYTGWL